jgi:hypothetical protein
MMVVASIAASIQSNSGMLFSSQIEVEAPLTASGSRGVRQVIEAQRFLFEAAQ